PPCGRMVILEETTCAIDTALVKAEGVDHRLVTISADHPLVLGDEPLTGRPPGTMHVVAGPGRIGRESEYGRVLVVVHQIQIAPVRKEQVVVERTQGARAIVAMVRDVEPAEQLLARELERRRPEITSRLCPNVDLIDAEGP